MTDGRLRGARTSRLPLIEHDTGIAEITVLRASMREGTSAYPHSRHRRPQVDRGDRLTVDALLGEQLDHVFLARLSEG